MIQRETQLLSVSIPESEVVQVIQSRLIKNGLSATLAYGSQFMASLLRTMVEDDGQGYASFFASLYTVFYMFNKRDLGFWLPSLRWISLSPVIVVVPPRRYSKRLRWPSIASLWGISDFGFPSIMLLKA